MTKPDLWQIYCKRWPHLLDPKAGSRLTVKGLKKLFDVTYDTGYTEGKKSGIRLMSAASDEDMMKFLGGLGGK
jgi:hypothetical protein